MRLSLFHVVESYAFMSAEFQANHGLDEFPAYCREMTLLKNPDVMIEWNRRRAKLQPGLWMGGPVLGFHKEDGRWVCEGIVDWSYD